MGSSNNQCAFPGCLKELTISLDNAESRVLGDAGAVIGEEAQIRCRHVDGPRYDADYPEDRVHCYPNLILLCPTHHTIVDKDGGRALSVEDLEAIRTAHEIATRVTESRDIVDVRTQLPGTDEMRTAHAQNKPSVPRPRTGRNGSPTYVRRSLASARTSTRCTHVLNSFDRDGDRSWELERKYKRIGWDPPLYEKLIAEFRVQCALTWCLAIELTRAENLVICPVREEVDPLYRFDEGVLLTRDGDGLINMQIVRLKYDRTWGDSFFAIDLEEWRSLILAKGERRQEEPDGISRYRMIAKFVPTSELTLGARQTRARANCDWRRPRVASAAAWRYVLPRRVGERA